MKRSVCTITKTDNEIQIRQTVKNLFFNKDIDECDDGLHVCRSSLASCVNTLDSFNCSCNHGYIGDGKTNCTVNASGKIGFKKFVVMFQLRIIKAVTVIFYTIAKVINLLYTSNFYSI